MMGMEFGMSADASPTNVKQCSSRPMLLVASTIVGPAKAGFLLHHEFTNATLYTGYSLLISAKACSHVAYTDSLTGTAFGCTDDSDNIDNIFMVPAWCEEDETVTEGLLPINQQTNHGTINGTSNRRI
jgi:hypothetical protein